jgi:hypothetical protein
MAEKKQKFQEESMTMQEPKTGSEFIAKKDFEIHHNEYHRVIKAGEDVSDVPKLFHENLRTEGVI